MDMLIALTYLLTVLYWHVPLTKIMHLVNQSMEASGGYDEVTTALQSAGKTPANHVHVVTLCFEVHYFGWIGVFRRYYCSNFVPQFSIRAVRFLYWQPANITTVCLIKLDPNDIFKLINDL